MLKLQKMLAMLLVISLIITQNIPQTNSQVSSPEILEEAINQETIEPEISGENSIVKVAEPEILEEVVEKREQGTKHFLLSDFSYEAAVYPHAVHYKEDGKWEDIDNTLVEYTTAKGRQVYKNKDNAYDVYLDLKGDAQELITIRRDGYEISWNLENANKSPVRKVETQKSEAQILTERQEVQALEKISSKAVYEEIRSGIDIEYVILPQMVKENIILKTKPEDETKFVFNINIENLYALKTKDGEIEFKSKGTGELVYKIKSPFMYDQVEGYSTKIEMLLEETEAGYKMTLIPDLEWLESKDRQYPVIIDPIVETEANVLTIHDNHVSSAFPTTNYYQTHVLKTGVSSISGTNRTYIKFVDMPVLKTGDMVVEAYLNVASYNYANGTQVNAHQITQSWDTMTINWNNKPAYSSVVEDYQIVQNNNTFYSWNVTGIVRNWYTGVSSNNGIMLRVPAEQTGTYTEYWSSDIHEYYAANRPGIILRYINNSGLESYWTYRSQSAGRAGTGYVNDFNGNLIYTHNTVSMSGNKMPVNVTHVYNSNDNNENIGYGSGWRTNFDQRVVSKTINGTNYLEYTDDTGTKHYFTFNQQEGKYTEETGKDLTIRTSFPFYILEDKQGNELHFYITTVPSGRLYRAYDKNGNFLQVNYSNNKISQITDGASRTTYFAYDASGNYLNKITEINGRETTFQYAMGRLWKINYEDGKTTEFGVHPTDLTWVKNHDGFRLTYTYATSGPRRVTKISESNTDGTVGEELAISYGRNETTFTDVYGKKTTYQFSYYGNTIGVKDSFGHGGFYDYQGDTNPEHKNRITASSRTQKTIINHLKNHNMESSTDWSLGEWSGSTGTGYYTTGDKYIGNRSLHINKTNTTGTHWYRQALNLQKGKTYTLSGYVKTSGISSQNGKGALLIARYEDSAGGQPMVKSKFINGTKNWQRLEVTFTVPADSVSTNVWIRAAIEGETGTAYFDGLQLEEGTSSNRYNLLENPDLTYAANDVPVFWSKNADCDNNDRHGMFFPPWIEHPSGMDHNTFRIIGEVDKTKRLRQSVWVYGNQGDVLTVGGWAKASSVPKTDVSRDFTIRIGIDYIDPATPTQWEYIRFNPDVRDWQYVSGEVIATEGDYSRIYFDLLYYRNVNTAYFDGLQLYKEEFSQSFVYDENGNVISVADLAAQQSTFEYDSDNNITKMTTPKGGSFTYDEYDENNNLLKATTATGIEYAFEYDNYGNPESTTVGDASLFIKSQAEYTSDGNYLEKIIDSRGKEVSYDFNPLTGLLDSITDANNTVTNYQYDIMDRLTEVSTQNGQDLITNSYYYDGDNLSEISHNGFSYFFDYDSMGNVENVKVGSQVLISHVYEQLSNPARQTGLLLRSNYGNGHFVEYGYDEIKRLKSKSFNGVEKFNYEYTGSGNIGFHEDKVNNVSYRYIYDLAERLSKVVKSNGYETTFQYDLNNSVSSVVEEIEGTTRGTTYNYDQDNKPTYSVPYALPMSHGYLYDAIGRVSSVKMSAMWNPFLYTQDYTYTAGANGSSTGLVENIDDGVDDISYEYDNNGNISAIIHNLQRIDYTYDALNQLVREDSQVQNRTFTYEYDLGGNILFKREYAYTTGTLGPVLDEKEYEYYTGTHWKDRLKSYDGGADITYDAIGNPTSYRGYLMGWQQGRQLSSMYGNGMNITYRYNDSGIRTRKYVYDFITQTSTTTDYHLVGDKITYQKTGSDSIYYHYDGAGQLFAMNYNGTYYFYTRNAQGDIIGILDTNGNRVVTYTYDAWGKILSATGTLASTIGQINPFRYRGYYYDNETGLYYLQSRYYDPEVGRFLNADVQLNPKSGLIGMNLFAYCINNPVNMIDPNGDVAFLTLLLVTAISVGVSVMVNAGIESHEATGKVDYEYAVNSGLSGFFITYSLGLSLYGGYLFLNDCRGYYASSRGSTNLNTQSSSSSITQSRGSSATKQPSNLREQLAIEQVKANPQGIPIANIKMADPRWPASEGWIKMQQKVHTSQGKIEIHYVYNRTIKIFDDFKIK